jgi:outer membrane receptor for monomeric catechols
VPVSVFTLLVNDTTCGKSGGINFNPGELLRCPNGQDWFGGEGGLELIKSLLLRGAPNKQNIFLGKIVEGTADFGEVFNEALIEVGKANEGFQRRAN